MIRNKSTIQFISRLLMAVFLFVIISPISVYASGDSVSDNDGSDYTDWDDALDDPDYAENLAQQLTKYWVSTWTNYTGHGQDVIDDVADMLGNQYDATVDLYENLYPYVLPFARQEVDQIVPGSLSNSIYGHPKRDQNSLALIQSLGNGLYDALNNATDDGFEKITNSKQKGDNVTPSIFPSYFHIALKNPAPNLNLPANHTPDGNNPCFVAKNTSGAWDYFHTVNFTSTDRPVFMFRPRSANGTDYDMGLSVYNASGSYVNIERCWRGQYSNGRWFDNQYTVTYSEYAAYEHDNDVYLWGSGYIEYKIGGGPYNTYYWNNSERKLYFIGQGRAIDFLGTTSSSDMIGEYTFNIINSVDFTDYTDLINQLMLDVNMGNNITNSLLTELLIELRNQNDIYQPTSDDDDIYDYIDYIMNKLLEVKDVHIEIPDISPDMNGIATALGSLLNFLASIIRAIGNIVSSLLEGLFHLFVPSESDWNEINIQFEILSAPLSWIAEFIAEASSNISLLLFGRNVTDFETTETEDVDLVMGESDVDPDIIYDPTSGAPKIPVRFSNSSSEIFSNIGDCYIIDMSWYTPYKPVGDIIVVAFCWIFFIWRVLHGLPGIINGATGSEDIRDDAQSKLNEMYLR